MITEEIIGRFGVVSGDQIHANEAEFPDEETAHNMLAKAYEEGEVTNYQIVKVTRTTTEEVIEEVS